MASLFNKRISDTYVSIIKSIDNAVISSTLKQLSDGSGNGLGIYVNTSGDFKVSGILEFGSLKDTAESITITKFVDEADGIANNDNDTTIPTSAAVKDYVDTQITAEDLDFAGDTGSGSVDLDSQVLTISGTTNEIETSASGQTLTVGLPTNVTISGEISVGSLKTSGVYYFNGNTISHLSNSDLIFGFKSTTGFRVSFNAGTTDELLIENGSITGEVILDEDNMASNSATKLATQQSIKAYVDSQVGANNELSEVLANGNTTGGTDISVSSGDDITFADSSQALFGAGSDLKILHNGTDSYIQNFTGTLQIQNQSDDKDILLRSDDGSGGIETYFYLDGSTNLNRFAVNARWDDNIQAQFGASADLKIYHDGSHSRIDDTGTGKLILRGNTDVEIHKYTGEYMITATADGAVKLYYDDSLKIETTSAGVSVTGSATVSSDLILSDYGSGTHTGTVTQRLGVTSSGQVVEIPIGGGAVDGSGTANTVTMWTPDSNTIGDAPITISGNNSTFAGVVTIGSTTGISASTKLAVSDTNGAGLEVIPQTSNDRVTLLSYDRNASTYQTLDTDSSDVHFNISGSEAMRLDSSGRLLINRTSSNGDILEVDGNANVYSARFNGNTTTGQSYGLRVRAGTNSSDKSMLVENTSGTDLFTIAGDGNSTFAGDLTVSKSGNTLLDIQSTNDNAIIKINANSGGTGVGNNQDPYLQFASGNTIKANIHYDNTSTDLIFQTNTNATALTLDNSQNATFAGDVTVQGGDILNASGNFTITSASDFIVDANNNISLDADGGIIKFLDAGSEKMRLDSSGRLGLNTSSPSTVLHIDQPSNDRAGGLYLETQGQNYGLSAFVNSGGYGVIGSNGTLTTDILTMNLSNGDTSFAGDVTLSSTAPILYLANTTSSTGKTWRLSSAPNGKFFITQEGVIDAITLDHTSGNATFAGDVTLSNASTPQLRVTDTTNSVISKIMSDNTTGYVGTHSDHNFSILRNNSVQATFTSTGLGLGTTSPSVELEVGGSTNTQILISTTNNTGNSQLYFGDSDSDTSGVILYRHDGDSMAFSTSGSERLRILSDGKIGINTSDVSHQLQLHNPSGNGSQMNFTDSTTTTTDGSGLRVGYNGTAGQMYLFENSYLRFGTNNSERMRITSGGDVLLRGTLNPYTLGNRGNITLNGTAGNIIAFTNNTSAKGYIYHDNTDLNIVNEVSASVNFSTAGSERLRITSDGEVLINTTSPISSVAGTLQVKNSSNLAYFQYTGGASGNIVFRNASNSTVGSINISSTATAYNTSSDYRLKEDLQDFNALEIASKIKMYDFKWKADDSRSYGVMAHELEEVLPQAVSGEKDAEEMQSVDYSKLVPILLKSIQELEARVKELENNV